MARALGRATWRRVDPTDLSYATYDGLKLARRRVAYPTLRKPVLRACVDTPQAYNAPSGTTALVYQPKEIEMLFKVLKLKCIQDGPHHVYPTWVVIQKIDAVNANAALKKAIALKIAAPVVELA